MQPTTQNAWHVTRGGQTYGPYTWEQIAEHARGGRIGRGDKIFDPRNNAWMKSSEVPGLFGPGGVAAAPAGISMAAKAAVGIILGLALVMGAVFTLDGLFDLAEGWTLGEAFDEGVDIAQKNSAPVISQSAQMPPEGLTYKGTFVWESKERDAPGGRLSHTEPCYLWIYTTDEGTAADFDYGTVDGWPVYLTSHSASRYVFDSSTRSKVEQVRIVADVTDTSMSGTVVNTTPDISSFIEGTFTGTAIPYEQYKSEAQ